MPSDTCVFILAGGQGSRLRPYTTVLPKPLIPVCDLPILEVVIHQLQEAGLGRIILAVNHHESLIRSYFGDGSSFGVEITYSREDTPMGTVGPLRLVADQLTDDFLVMNGDLLTDLDYVRLLERHRASGCGLTLGVYRRVVRISDGVLDIDEGSRVTGFREKPEFGFRISMGVYAMDRSILSRIPAEGAFGMDDLARSLLADDEPINAFEHKGEWYDIGCPSDLERAAEAFSRRRWRFVGTSPRRLSEAEPAESARPTPLTPADSPAGSAADARWMQDRGVRV